MTIDTMWQIDNTAIDIPAPAADDVAECSVKLNYNNNIKDKIRNVI